MMPPVAILAGGLATRLHPITSTVPKSMLQVAGKPFIAHQLALLRKKGITRIVLCTGHLGGQIMDFVGNGQEFGLSVDYSSDGDCPLGTGGAVMKALTLMGDHFFVMYGDSYLDIDFKAIYDRLLLSKHQGIMTVIKNNDRWDKSNTVFHEGHIIAYDKSHKTSGMAYIDYGLILFRKAAFERMDGRMAFDLGELLGELVCHKQMLGIEVTQRFYEIGSVSGLKETEAYLLNPNSNQG